MQTTGKVLREGGRRHHWYNVTFAAEKWQPTYTCLKACNDTHTHELDEGLECGLNEDGKDNIVKTPASNSDATPGTWPVEGC